MKVKTGLVLISGLLFALSYISEARLSENDPFYIPPSDTPVDTGDVDTGDVDTPVDTGDVDTGPADTGPTYPDPTTDQDALDDLRTAIGQDDRALLGGDIDTNKITPENVEVIPDPATSPYKESPSILTQAPGISSPPELQAGDVVVKLGEQSHLIYRWDANENRYELLRYHLDYGNTEVAGWSDEYEGGERTRHQVTAFKDKDGEVERYRVEDNITDTSTDNGWITENSLDVREYDADGNPVMPSELQEYNDFGGTEFGSLIQSYDAIDTDGDGEFDSYLFKDKDGNVLLTRTIVRVTDGVDTELVTVKKVTDEFTQAVKNLYGIPIETVTKIFYELNIGAVLSGKIQGSEALGISWWLPSNPDGQFDPRFKEYVDKYLKKLPAQIQAYCEHILQQLGIEPGDNPYKTFQDKLSELWLKYQLGQISEDEQKILGQLYSMYNTTLPKLLTLTHRYEMAENPHESKWKGIDSNAAYNEWELPGLGTYGQGWIGENQWAGFVVTQTTEEDGKPYAYAYLLDRLPSDPDELGRHVERYGWFPVVKDNVGDYKVNFSDTSGSVSTAGGGVVRGGGGSSGGAGSGGGGGGGGNATGNGGYTGPDVSTIIDDVLGEIPLGNLDEMIDYLAEKGLIPEEFANHLKSLTAGDGRKRYLEEVIPDAEVDNLRRGILRGLGLEDDVVGEALSRLGNKEEFISYMTSVLMEKLGLSEEEAREKAELLYLLLTNLGVSGVDIRTYLEKLGYTQEEIDEFVSKLEEMKEAKRQYLADLGIEEGMIEEILMLDRESAEEVLKGLGLSDEEIAEFFALEDEVKAYLEDKMGITDEEVINQLLVLDEEMARAFLENRSLDIDIDEFLALETDEEKLEYLKNYFMNEKGMSEEEAIQRAQEIMDEIKNMPQESENVYSYVDEFFKLMEDGELSEELLSWLESIGLTTDEIDTLARMLSRADGDKFLAGFGLTEDEILKYRYLQDEETGRAYAILKEATDYYLDLYKEKFPDVSEEELKKNAEFVAMLIAGIDENLDPVSPDSLLADFKKWLVEAAEEAGLDKEGLDESFKSLIGWKNTATGKNIIEEGETDSDKTEFYKSGKHSVMREKIKDKREGYEKEIEEALRKAIQDILDALFEGEYLPLDEESVKEYAKSVFEEIKNTYGSKDGDEDTGLPQEPPDPVNWEYEVAPWEYPEFVEAGIDTKEKFYNHYRDYFETTEEYEAWKKAWEDWIELHSSVYI